MLHQFYLQIQPDDLKKLDERTFLAVFDGVPQFNVKLSDLKTPLLDFLSVKTQIFNSKGDARRMIIVMQ